MKDIKFHANAFQDYNEFASNNKKVYKKIVELIKDIERDPFKGIGKPEPLKYKLSSYWSRRIDDEHRLIYKVTENEIIIISCRYHYK